MGEPVRLLHKGEATRRASFLELFFDLVFVFSLNRVVARAVEDLTTDRGHNHLPTVLAGGGKTALLLLILWSVWQQNAWTTSRYDPYHPIIQLSVLIALVSSMVIGVGIPRAFGINGGALVVAGYLIAQLSRPALLAVALRGTPRQRLKIRTLIVYSCTGIIWILGFLLVKSWPRLYVWGAALAIEYLANRTGWPVPGLGRSAPAKWDIAGAHLAERYQQFFLVALGEAILVDGLSYARSGFGALETAAFAIALGITILIWRIYFYRAGEIFAEAVGRARRPARIGRSAADSHLLMVAGVVATAIGYDLAIEHPMGHTPPAWIAVIAGGPALYMIGRSRFEREVFDRVSPSRLVAIGVLALVFPALFWAPTVAVLFAVGLVLFGVALADARRAWGKPPEPPAPPL
ncbi:low temperature requirement protein A [Plantactinospora sp. KBS50]|uniref:low temperature requirement protein A n=1 Tax=Plantactinospora sp. KBS50 TaxID=2024580 RepID=UPI001E31EEB2|nr:low temperature requirement protein A [Plantactinospora sp. KBS50]